MSGGMERRFLPPVVTQALDGEKDGAFRDDEGNVVTVTTTRGVREMRFVPAERAGSGENVRGMLFYHHPPLAERPAALPDGLPFVPDLDGTVGTLRGSPFGMWRPAGDEELDAWARRLADALPDDPPQWLVERVEALAASTDARERPAAEEPGRDEGTAEGGRGWMGPDGLAAIKGLFGGGDPGRKARLEDGRDALVAAAEADGWSRVSGGRSVPGIFSTVLLGRGDRRRHVVVAGMGPHAMLTLFETPADD